MINHNSPNKNDPTTQYIIAAIYFIAIFSVAITFSIAALLEQYSYDQSWVSAHFAIIARNFLEYGVLGLGGVPIQNNPPLTLSPDTYGNWPPLYPITLSYVFAIFGESERVQHIFSALINLATATILFAFTRRAAGSIIAAVVVVFFFNIPIAAKFGHAGLHLYPTMMFYIASLYCFVLATDQEKLAAPQLQRRYAILGAAMIFLGVMASWEATLVVPGLLLAALLRRDWYAFRLAFLYGLVATIAVAAVLTLYHSRDPALLQVILERIGFYAGLASGDAHMERISPHLLHVFRENPSTIASPFVYFLLLTSRLNLLGTPGALALTMMVPLLALRAARTTTPWLYMIFGMLSVYLSCAVIMPHHNQIHEHQILLLVPPAALAIGFVLTALRKLGAETFSLNRKTFAIICLTLCILALWERSAISASLYFQYSPTTNPEIQFGHAIANRVEPGAIVAYTEVNPVPVYYARRHIIRGVYNEARLVENLAAIEALCPSCPIYMAIQAGRHKDFPNLLRKSPKRFDTPYGTLVPIKPPR